MAGSGKQRRRVAAPSTLLRKLQQVRDSFSGEAARHKQELLRPLEHKALPRAEDVLALHEILCFLRAYPDDREVLKQVEKMLARFGQRADLRRHRRVLADTGIAGTRIQYAFFWFTARWLAQRWPDCLSIDWSEFEAKDRLEGMLSLLLPYSETPDELDLSLRECIEQLKGPRETDAAFLIRRFQALRTDSFGREKLYDDLEIPIRLAPGPGTPSRTHARYRGAPVVFQTGPMILKRPVLRRALQQTRLTVRDVSPREGQRLIDLARESMVTRSRDLDVFEYGDKNDVRLVDCGGGLQFACIGAVPERRLMVETVYGFLTLKNGVPTGYVLASALFGSSEVAYNVFETFRGGESAHVYGRVLALVQRLFGADAFAVDPYQLGHNNEEGLKSGAWWFYYKLGFRPHDPEVRRVMNRELARMKKNRRHRSSLATLKELSSESVFYYLGRQRRQRKEVLGRISVGNIGLATGRYVAGRFGADREKATRTCAREAARLLGVRSFKSFSAGERLWWKRWSPLVLALPGIERWSGKDKRALVKVIRAKGGRRESDFVRLFDGHRRLRRAVLKLAGEK